MEVQKVSLNQIADAMPQHFEFYHLGDVTLHPISEWNLKDVRTIAFNLIGDIRVLMIVLFEKDLDMSVYSEMGNILASKVASSLSQKGMMDWVISPPQVLNENQYQQLIQESKVILRKAYAHRFNQTLVPVETIILPVPHEEVGHA